MSWKITCSTFLYSKKKSLSFGQKSQATFFGWIWKINLLKKTDAPLLCLLPITEKRFDAGICVVIPEYSVNATEDILWLNIFYMPVFHRIQNEKMYSWHITRNIISRIILFIYPFINLLIRCWKFWTVYSLTGWLKNNVFGTINWLIIWFPQIIKTRHFHELILL